MKERIHLISTCQRAFKPLVGMLIVFSLWGTNNAIAATSLEAAIPQGSLFDVISARAKKLAEQDYIASKNIQIVLIIKTTAQSASNTINRYGKMKGFMSCNCFTQVFYIKPQSKSISLIKMPNLAASHLAQTFINMMEQQHT